MPHVDDDPCELICDALVAAVNARTEFEHKVTASSPEDPNTLLEREYPDTQFFFVPWAEEADKIGRGGEVAETFVVTLLVVRKLGEQVNRRMMGRFTRQVRTWLRGQRMAGYVFAKDETVSKFDLEVMAAQNQFLAVVRLSYKGCS